MLRIAGFSEESIVDGPGIRLTVFTQGCPHQCKGCHNPQTWDFNGGELVDSSVIFDRLQENKLLRGVTFSGGEPLMQAEAIAPVAEEIRKRGYDVWLYTGFLYEQVKTMPVMRYIDILVDGKFDISKKSMELRYRGSRNQRIIDVQASLSEKQIVLNVEFY